MRTLNQEELDLISRLNVSEEHKQLVATYWRSQTKTPTSHPSKSVMAKIMAISIATGLLLGALFPELRILAVYGDSALWVFFAVFIIATSSVLAVVAKRINGSDGVKEKLLDRVYITILASPIRNRSIARTLILSGTLIGLILNRFTATLIAYVVTVIILVIAKLVTTKLLRQNLEDLASRPQQDETE